MSVYACDSSAHRGVFRLRMSSKTGPSGSRSHGVRPEQRSVAMTSSNEAAETAARVPDGATRMATNGQAIDTESTVQSRESPSVCWLTLPESRPNRELRWLSSMQPSSVVAVGEQLTGDPVPFVIRPYRRVTRRFVEAGALAWFAGLGSVDVDVEWVASLELCALVTGQASSLARRLKARQAVLTWGNDSRNPLYLVPPYRQATNRAKRADLMICLTEAARDHCLQLGIPDERCRVVLPPVDTELFRPPERPVEEPIAVFCSPLAPNKGIDRVLDAFDLVRAREQDARLLVLGSGPLERMVKERAAESGGAIEYLGARDRAGVSEVLRRCAVLVTAPRPTAVWNEQFGLAYVEAMACGLCVVTTACGTNHEAVRPPNLRVADDVGELAEALMHFLGDPGRRAVVGARNRAEVVERFEMRQQVALLRQAFLA
jgi:phosphatidylinositol alpha-1,6-mannosyltransferase